MAGSVAGTLDAASYRVAVIDTQSSATIATGQTASAEVDLFGFTLVGLFIPSTFDGTTLTFTVATESGGTFVTLQTAGADLTITTAASKYVALDPSLFAGVRWFKIVAGSSQTTTDTVITLSKRPV